MKPQIYVDLPRHDYTTLHYLTLNFSGFSFKLQSYPKIVNRLIHSKELLIIRNTDRIMNYRAATPFSIEIEVTSHVLKVIDDAKRKADSWICRGYILQLEERADLYREFAVVFIEPRFRQGSFKFLSLSRHACENSGSRMNDTGDQQSTSFPSCTISSPPSAASYRSLSLLRSSINEEVMSRFYNFMEILCSLDFKRATEQPYAKCLYTAR